MALRRSPIPRGTKPLESHTPLERHVGLAQVGRRRAAEAEAAGKPVRATLTSTYRPTIPVDKRAALEKRSGGVCELQLSGCTWWATDVCHRRTQGMGGRFGDAKEEIDQLSDAMHGCRNCHTRTHRRTKEALEDGQRLKDAMNPLTEPVLYRGVLSYLDDEGGVHGFDEVGA